METNLQTIYQKMKSNNNIDTNVVVYYDEVNRWLFVSCANQPKLKEIKQGFKRCLNLAAKHQCTRLIIDGYAVKYTAELSEVSDWLSNQWLLAAETQGLRYVAQLVPSEVDQQLIGQPSTPLNLRVESFHSLVNAVRWLYTQK
jgi:hypothetical protein